MRVFLALVALGCLAGVFVAAWLVWCEAPRATAVANQAAADLDELARRVAEVEVRERQLRAFVVRRAIPQRIPDRVEDPRLLGDWHLDPDTLEWGRHHFGVDRSKLKPGNTGEVSP